MLSGKQHGHHLIACLMCKTSGPLPALWSKNLYLPSPHPSHADSGSGGLCLGQDSVLFLPTSQVMPVLLVHGPHSALHVCRGHQCQQLSSFLNVMRIFSGYVKMGDLSLSLPCSGGHLRCRDSNSARRRCSRIPSSCFV